MKHFRFNYLLFTWYRVNKQLVAFVATCSIGITQRKTRCYVDCHCKSTCRIQVSLCSTETLPIHNSTSLVLNHTKVKHRAYSEDTDSQNNGLVLPDATDATHLHLATHVITPSCYTNISIFATFFTGYLNDSERNRNARGRARYLISQSILGVLMSKATNPNMPRGSASLDSPAGVTLSLHPPPGLCPAPAKGTQPFRNLDGG